MLPRIAWSTASKSARAANRCVAFSAMASLIYRAIALREGGVATNLGCKVSKDFFFRWRTTSTRSASPPRSVARLAGYDYKSFG